MTEDQTSLIFKEGVQFDANKLQAGGGSGLGLCIAKGIIDRHNGVIRAESRGTNLGSTFTVILPLYEDCSRVSDFGGRLFSTSVAAQDMCVHDNDLDSNHSESSTVEGDSQSDKLGSSPATSTDHMYQSSPESNVDGSPESVSTQLDDVSDDAQPKRKSHKILVAEDVLASRKMLIRLLERAGHECVVACNGREAVEVIRNANYEDLEEGKQKIDTILMDYEMPRKFVYRVIPRRSSFYSALPLTAYSIFSPIVQS
jgi:hypothetical protein